MKIYLLHDVLIKSNIKSLYLVRVGLPLPNVLDVGWFDWWYAIILVFVLLIFFAILEV